MTKREDRNLQSRKRILESALREFAKQGYGLSSINTICDEGDISKGSLYHYYESKDALYLACVEKCFHSLTAYLQAYMEGKNQADVQSYFDARLRFFQENPIFQRVFCETIISPPEHLKTQIEKIKENFDALNTRVLTNLLQDVKLRSDTNIEQAMELFRLFQDFVNVRSQMTPHGEINIEKHEELSSRALQVLLYGLVERKETME